MEEQQILKQIQDLKNAKIYLEDLHQKYRSRCREVDTYSGFLDHDQTNVCINKQLDKLRLNLAKIRDE